MIKYFLFSITLLMAVNTGLWAQRKNVGIVFIGNSITEGQGLKITPPMQAAAYLENQARFKNLKFSNRGVSGATTLDFLPGAKRGLLERVEKAADELNTNKKTRLVFSIMIGTNDSAIEGPFGAPVSSDQYEANVKTIIDRLLARYPKSRVIVNRPIWYSPNTYNRSRYLQEGLDRLQGYFPVIEKIVADYAVTQPGRVLEGDKEGFEFFKGRESLFEAEKGNAGTFFLHPNDEGAVELGNLWGKAIQAALGK